MNQQAEKNEKAFIPLAAERYESTPESRFKLRLLRSSADRNEHYEESADRGARQDKEGAGGADDNSSEHDEPQLSVEREGDTIRRIRIECCCGCVIDISCEYQGAEANPGNEAHAGDHG
ncbi:MAG: hypothetical protein K9N48_03365 [Verrucomicrobia bacterium]|nr:hypothetical protein [Verrucomicrobiota bacterium]MCF7707917.1 hypothetical protein [Verrucomicrobiota bacterium]